MLFHIFFENLTNGTFINDGFVVPGAFEIGQILLSV